MNSITQAQALLGEIFVIGFEGKQLSDDTSAFLSQAKIGGVVLFSQNYEAPEQLGELINNIQESRSEFPLWIATDQEGGRVQRFKEPFTIIPPAAVVGRAASPRAAFDISQISAKELKAVGINLNFGPVADILTNKKNPVIGDRAYGSDEGHVSRIVTAVVRGMVTNGIQACAKHFPGHGDTEIDSHFGLPKINRTEDELKDREFKPFVKIFKSRCNFVMTAHIINEAIDPEFPATLSRKTLQQVLRKNMRYTRIIVSDDMEMKAITDHFGADESPLLAVQAGCDLLVYRSEGAARHAYEILYRSLENGKLLPEVILQAAERSRTLKKEFFKTFSPVEVREIKNIVGIPEHAEAVQRAIG